ncbi:MAG TPA: KTSC domain-containing protein [Terracidiphilus sp.]|nr:KTSC domain-containing protein [Terracidiphilus sp.]
MPVAKPSRMTNPVTVKSSSLVQVAYDSQRAILQVAFRDGTAYRYDGVPLRVYHGLLQAESKGAYFNRYIRSLFPHKPFMTPNQPNRGDLRYNS